MRPMQIVKTSIVAAGWMNAQPTPDVPPAPAWKRATDLICCLVVLPILALITLFVSILVKCLSPGPVFFRQVRVGQDGHHFRVLKFRTMVIDAEARLAALKADNERSGPLFKMDRDPRIEVGRAYLIPLADGLQWLHEAAAPTGGEA